MELNQLWQSALNDVEVQLSKANFVTWLKSSQLIDKKDGTFFVGLPNHFAKEWVENKYHKNILGALRNYDATARKVEFLVVSQNQTQFSQKKTVLADFSGPENHIGLEYKIDPQTNLNPRYTFQSFVVGSSNELAYAAASAIVKDIGVKYNPFFVYGGVGLGKTHLIQAIGNEIMSVYNKKVLPRYVSSEKFTRDVVWAIRNKRMEDIKKQYREVDVLIIDDIQFIGGKEKTEEEFFHTFNTLYENNKQIIISSDRPPKSIPTLEERLRSRFEGGLIADIGYPEYEMRLAIIKNKLQNMNKTLTENIIDFVARNVKKNIREIEGVLKQILFVQDTNKVTITQKTAEEIVKKLIKNFSQQVSDMQVLKAVAEFYRVSVEDLSNRSRQKQVVEPRQVAMYLLRDILDMSYPYIGEKMGRDHTTAIHAIEKIGEEINQNSGLNQKILAIKDLIYKNG